MVALLSEEDLQKRSKESYQLIVKAMCAVADCTAIYGREHTDIVEAAFQLRDDLGLTFPKAVDQKPTPA